jgi:beta-lactamase class A
MDRRGFLVAGGAAIAATSGWAATSKIGVLARPAADPFQDRPFQDRIARIEAASGARLGVALHDTGTGRRFAWRGDERFAMLSTFKLLLAGAVFARVQQGKERLDRRLKVTQSDVVGYSPFATGRAGGTASVAELCRAMTVESDNGAANVMLAAIGGPAAMSLFLRQIGDTATRMDRDAPALTEARPGDRRDGTGERLGWALAPTTPIAMQDNAERLWLGPMLTPAHRTQLINWAIEARTGRTRLRAGLPARWRAGDKTGTGDDGSNNDVAIFWPPKRKPVVVASCLSANKLTAEAAGAVHAEVARAMVAMIEGKIR